MVLIRNQSKSRCTCVMPGSMAGPKASILRRDIHAPERSKEWPLSYKNVAMLMHPIFPHSAKISSAHLTLINAAAVDCFITNRTLSMLNPFSKNTARDVDSSFKFFQSITASSILLKWFGDDQNFITD